MRGKAKGIGGALAPPAPSAFERPTPATVVASLVGMSLQELVLQWRNHLGASPPVHLPRWLLMRVLAFRIQAAAFGDLDRSALRTILAGGDGGDRTASPARPPPFASRRATMRDGAKLNPGALLAREWHGRVERVMVLEEGYAWNGSTFPSLSRVAKAITGTSWNGHRFFGLRTKSGGGKSGGGKSGEGKSGRVSKEKSVRGAPR